MATVISSSSNHLIDQPKKAALSFSLRRKRPAFMFDQLHGALTFSLIA